jgi:Uma2 family endonuclease
MPSTTLEQGCYRGLRMTADEYLALGETTERYELIDGVVSMSPSPTFRHQQVITEIASQIRNYVSLHPIGAVAVEIDVRLADDLVYRPDVIFLSAEKAARCAERVTEVPEVVVEVVSPDSRAYDRQTKRQDYERFGVGEYWIIDPERDSLTFLRSGEQGFVEAPVAGDAYRSHAISGFSLDLARLRALWQT